MLKGLKRQWSASLVWEEECIIQKFDSQSFVKAHENFEN